MQPPTAWNKSSQLSYITTFQLKYLYHTEMMSLRHKPCHQPPLQPHIPITSVPLSRLMFYGAKTARDPLVLLDCGPCDMEEQLGPTSSLNSASHTNRQAHTNALNLQSEISAPHCELPDSPLKCFQLVRSLQYYSGEQRTQQNNNHVIRNGGHVKPARSSWWLHLSVFFWFTQKKVK